MELMYKTQGISPSLLAHRAITFHTIERQLFPTMHFTFASQLILGLAPLLSHTVLADNAAEHCIVAQHHNSGIPPHFAVEVDDYLSKDGSSKERISCITPADKVDGVGLCTRIKLDEAGQCWRGIGNADVSLSSSCAITILLQSL